MEVKSTLRVIDQANVSAQGGVTDGQTLKRMIGHKEEPTDRLRVALATYQPGTIEDLHWHSIEACCFIISGHAIVRDIEGKECHVGAGTLIYTPPGLAGAHEWEVKESLQLLSIRATTDSARRLQFTVDKATKRSFIDVEELASRGGLSFKSHY